MVWLNEPKQKTEATEAQWRDLYAAADAFKKMACWKWMDESAIFGVQSPVDGQNYFCSIMGEGGMNFGLVAYRGYQGYLVLHKLLSLEDDTQETGLDRGHDVYSGRTELHV